MNPPPPDPAPAWPPVALDGTQARRMRAAANGGEYGIELWIPPGPPPPGGFPVVYVLDANALFGTFVEAIRRSSRRPDATGIAAAAVVGIAHAGGELFATGRRRLDYTTAAPAEAGEGSGGADAFLSFIVDELAPALRSEFALDATRQVLFGHSLAGYFVLHALAARPGAFRVHAAVSPSIWWDEAGLRARLAALARDAARVFLAVGEWEAEVPPWQRGAPGYEQLLQRRAQRRMVANAQATARQLRETLGEDAVAFHLFPEEDHASVLMIAIQRVLRFALAPVAVG